MNWAICEFLVNHFYRKGITANGGDFRWRKASARCRYRHKL
jgi:hypothetical protein